MKANAVHEGLQFLSIKDLILNEKSVVRARWFGEEKTLKLANATGFCGHKRKPPIEEAIKKFCNQLG